MIMYTNNINDLIDELETNDRNLKTRILKDIAKFIDWATTNDLNKLTAHLLRTNDVEINFKIFLLLGLAITANPHHRISLAKSSALYTKAEYLLSKGLLIGSVGLLDYLTALVIVDGEEQNAISVANNAATVAKHAIRTSGCLGQMTNYFLNKFMQCTDIWRPLCRCLAECCRAVPLSQNEISHLLPRCIQELRRDRNVEVIILVQAILEDHPLNKVKFLQFQGIQCFNPEVLQMPQGLHLLCTLIDSCKEAMEVALASDIHKILHHLANKFNLGSELEKWRSLALFHLSSSNQRVIPNVEKYTNANIPTSSSNITSQATDVITANRSREVFEKLKNIQNDQMNYKQIDQSFEILQHQFYQHVNKIDAVTKPYVQENRFSAHEQNTRKDTNFLNTRLLQTANVFNDTNYLMKSGLENFSSVPFTDRMQNRKSATMSFKNNTAINTNNSIQFNNNARTFKNFNAMSQSEQSCQTSFNDSKATATYFGCGSRNQQLDEISFHPRQTSTPKNNLKRLDELFDLNFEDLPEYDMSQSNKTIDLSNIRFNNRKNKKSRRSENVTINDYVSRRRSSSRLRRSRSRLNKTSGDKSMTKNVENKSLITSVLNVTTFGLFGRVKTFLSSSNTEEKQRKKKSSPTAIEFDSTDTDSIDITKSTISDFDSDNDYSFLEESLVINKGKLNKKQTHQFIKQRSNQKPVHSKNYNATNNIACTTCNDTSKLTRKVNKNKHLKGIVKKIHTGVKKYGCNFEKICQVYWPDDESMKPKDLSHLYHKIIAKK